MNKKQYNNVIDWTLKHEPSAQTDDSLATARAIFNNLGVALPNGNIGEVFDIIKTDDYMGWKSCTMQEAQEAADNGVAAIGISPDRIVVLSASDEEDSVVETASVMTLSETTSAYAVADLQYYTYSNATTIYVGMLSIFSYAGGDSSSSSGNGHSYVSFKNTCDRAIRIGGYDVPSGAEITLGTYGNIKEHKGIWYNYESYDIHVNKNPFVGLSLSINITLENVNSVNEIIENNDTWSLFKNCAYFAKEVWNSVSSIKLGSEATTPAEILEDIAEVDFVGCRQVEKNLNVGYMKDGVFFVVENVPDTNGSSSWI